MTLRVRKSPRLLELAKKFFGNDLVVEAYITTWELADNDYEHDVAEIDEVLRGQESRVESGDSGVIIDSYDEYILEFINGKRLRFNTSEQAYITDETDKELEFV